MPVFDCPPHCVILPHTALIPAVDIMPPIRSSGSTPSFKQQTNVTPWPPSSASRIDDASCLVPGVSQSPRRPLKITQPSSSVPAHPSAYGHPYPPNADATPKRFPCPYLGCQKSFDFNCYLTRHFRFVPLYSPHHRLSLSNVAKCSTHTKEKPWVCICGSELGYKETLVRHVKASHPNQPVYAEFLSSLSRAINAAQPVLQAGYVSQVTPPRPSTQSSSGTVASSPEVPIASRLQVYRPEQKTPATSSEVLFGPLTRPKSYQKEVVPPTVDKPKVLNGSAKGAHTAAASKCISVDVGDSEDEDYGWNELSQSDLEGIESLEKMLELQQRERTLKRTLGPSESQLSKLQRPYSLEV